MKLCVHKIGVLLIEDESNNFTRETFEHQEYLKRYEIIGKDELKSFVEGGRQKILENRNIETNIAAFDKNFRSASYKVDRSSASLKSVAVGTGTTTAFYGDE